jgi:hypothetical protein
MGYDLTKYRPAQSEKPQNFKGNFLTGLSDTGGAGFKSRSYS